MPAVRTLHVALVGAYDAHVTAHRATPRALALAAARLGIAVAPRWLPTDAIPERDPLGRDGLRPDDASLDDTASNDAV